MTIEELNKLIKEELDSYLNENEEEEVDAKGGDDIEVTTDEPAEDDDALDTLRQIFNMLKPLVEPEEEPEEEEPEMDDAEEAEEEGDPEPDEEDLEEMIFEDKGGPTATDLMALLKDIGIPAVLLQKDNGLNGLKRVMAKPPGRPRLAALKSWFASRGTDAAAKGDDVEENLDRPNYKASDVSDAGYDAEKTKGGLNESVERFKKLANIKR